MIQRVAQPSSLPCVAPIVPWRKSSLPNGRATPSIALKKAERYCAYQDRCHQEVRRKLYDLGLYRDDVDQVMATLIETQFLDEERFARSFARGKFRMKAWGRVRITQELKQRQVSAYCIRAGLSEIDEAAYAKTLDGLMEKYVERKGEGLDDFTLKGKLYDLGQRKGYEWEQIKGASLRALAKRPPT